MLDAASHAERMLRISSSSRTAFLKKVLPAFWFEGFLLFLVGVVASGTFKEDPFFRKELRLVGSWMGSMAELRFGLDLVKAGRIQAALDAVLPLRAAREAHERISRSAVKKAWHSIYERVSSSDPDLVPCAALTEEPSSERGKGKKQRLIAYLHEHPEELRPARDN